MMAAKRLGEVSTSLSSLDARQLVAVDAETAIRRLTLDADDLRIECDRLKALLIDSETEILLLKERVTKLQHDSERVRRLAPRGSGRMARAVLRLLGRL